MWLLILTVIILNVIFFFMPMKLTSIEIYSTCMFAMVLQQIVDLALDLKLDWYGYFDPGVQWGYFIAIVGIYPAVNAIFLNYYQYMKSNAQKFWYILGCSIFAVIYEWFAVKYGGFEAHSKNGSKVSSTSVSVVVSFPYKPAYYFIRSNESACTH